MALADYLEIGRIATNAELADKPAALTAVAELLAEGAAHSHAEILAVLEERERLATTGVGSGVAVPHGRMPIGSTRAALLIAPDGVEFNAIDGRAVSLVLGVLAPQDQPTLLLRMLAEASRVLREPDVRQRLVGCSEPLAALQILEEFA